MIYFQIFSFQNFLDGTNGVLQFFSFLSSGMADYFQISKMKIQIFSFPCGGMANFFHHFKISKMNSFQMFHGGINEKNRPKVTKFI
jgi:hypothetical protein